MTISSSSELNTDLLTEQFLSLTDASSLHAVVNVGRRVLLNETNRFDDAPSLILRENIFVASEHFLSSAINLMQLRELSY
jgi:hypothetical protein